MRNFVLIVALALPIAGCGVPGTQPAPWPAPTTTAPSPAPTTNAPVDAGTASKALDGFVTTVQKRMPKVVADRRDEELEAVAEQSCALLASGADARTIAAVARTLGTADPYATDLSTAHRLVKLSIATVCPAEKRRAREF
jgi:hypothetical protein